MPKINDIAFGRDIGKTDFRGRHIWLACKVCGKERWVRLYRYNQGTNLCCRGHSLKTKTRIPGQKITQYGYVLVRLYPDDFFYSMANKQGYVFEHRLVVAKRLGRLLLKQEKIHHKNGIKDDNKDTNLELISQADHITYRQMCSHCELRKEIRLLQWQIKELTIALQCKLSL